ncbi:uncharacterized protein F4812DRAFT_425795 [Daldinia caldariorum]|uniref:uncharacterized protein n=1 Tax=Daldinia caldariorum TaxID=326644 RepID=UPI0020083FD6|nr:uncharacterized protein F4812DRAFT_425795 [Daldinia caldariorum]KAI1468164.1 hypothetical protein F4812DRAFT_425795 [Daldinia caldariorum]
MDIIYNGTSPPRLRRSAGTGTNTKQIYHTNTNTHNIQRTWAGWRFISFTVVFIYHSSVRILGNRGIRHSRHYQHRYHLSTPRSEGGRQRVTSLVCFDFDPFLFSLLNQFLVIFSFKGVACVLDEMGRLKQTSEFCKESSFEYRCNWKGRRDLHGETD